MDIAWELYSLRGPVSAESYLTPRRGVRGGSICFWIKLPETHRGHRTISPRSLPQPHRTLPDLSNAPLTSTSQEPRESEDVKVRGEWEAGGPRSTLRVPFQHLPGIKSQAGSSQEHCIRVED